MLLHYLISFNSTEWLLRTDPLHKRCYGAHPLDHIICLSIIYTSLICKPNHSLVVVYIFPDHLAIDYSFHFTFRRMLGFCKILLNAMWNSHCECIGVHVILCIATFRLPIDHSSLFLPSAAKMVIQRGKKPPAQHKRPWSRNNKEFFRNKNTSLLGKNKIHGECARAST